MDTLPAMNGIGPGFVPRPDQYPELRTMFSETHSLEAERRRSERFRVFGGWGLAGLFAIFAFGELVQNISRPLPKDHFEIAILHPDGSYTPPMDEKDLTPMQQREVLETSLVNYITYRAGYTYAASQHDYDVVSSMTGGDAQTRYQRVMLSPSDPESPLVKYGMKAQIVPLDIRLDPDPTSPNEWNFSYTQHLMMADAPPQDTPMRGSFTFVRGPVPLRFRIPYDPASVVVLQYEDHPAQVIAR